MIPGSVRHRLDGDIGEIVRDARRRAGLTQGQLADAIGSTQSAVSRWERGHDVPRADTLVEILRACGFEADLWLRLSDTGVDRAQIRGSLSMKPEDRVASSANVSRMLASVKRG